MEIKNGVLTNVKDSDITDGFFNIPSSVTTIGNNAFWRCENLVNINIPSSVVTIGGGAFAECKNLVHVNIPSSVVTIDDNAFCGCKNLADINVPSSSVVTIGKGAFSCCKSLISVNIPMSVTTIDSWAFSCCESLVNINIPSSVTAIGYSAFYGCKSLANIDIPSSVATIGDNAFHGCEDLVSVNIPSSVTTIGDYAFTGCENVKEITFTNADGQTITYKCQCIDGILTLIQSQKTISDEITIYKAYVFNGMKNGSLNLKDCYIAKSDEVFAHGATLKDAVSDLTFKIAKERGQEQYSHLTLDSIVSFDDAKIAYRVITGACEMGTNQFIESLDEIKDSYTIRELIALTDGQYGSDMFKEFFDD